MDTFSKSERSRIMASVKSSGNKSTEQKFIRILKERHITGWRRGYSLTGKPDFVFPSGRIAVFIDGCFWHKCPKHCRIPATNTEYWVKKIDRNERRDKQVTRELKRKDWTVIRFWEHDLKGGSVLTRKLNRIKRLLE